MPRSTTTQDVGTGTIAIAVKLGRVSVLFLTVVPSAIEWPTRLAVYMKSHIRENQIGKNIELLNCESRNDSPYFAWARGIVWE